MKVSGRIEVGAQKYVADGAVLWRPTIWFVDMRGERKVEWQGGDYLADRDAAASLAFTKFEELLADPTKVRRE